MSKGGAEWQKFAYRELVGECHEARRLAYSVEREQTDLGQFGRDHVDEGTKLSTRGPQQKRLDVGTETSDLELVVKDWMSVCSRDL